MKSRNVLLKLPTHPAPVNKQAALMVGPVSREDKVMSSEEIVETCKQKAHKIKKGLEPAQGAHAYALNLAASRMGHRTYGHLRAHLGLSPEPADFDHEMFHERQVLRRRVADLEEELRILKEKIPS